MGSKVTKHPRSAAVKNANEEGAAGWMLLLEASSRLPPPEGVPRSAEDHHLLFDLQFDCILGELSEANRMAEDVVHNNIDALGTIAAIGDRIDRLNRDNQHSLAKLVTGSVE